MSDSITSIEAQIVTVCDSCVVVAANGDESARCDCTSIDAHDANECGSQSIGAAIELLITCAPTGSTTPAGYWQCFVCDQIELGPAALYEIADR